VLLRERIQRLLHRALVQLQHRVAIALLVARVRQRIERQRVLVRSGDRLLDQAADDAGFERGELDVHAARVT
jgi:hypothetical protein